MATNSNADEKASLITNIDQHVRSIVYNPSLNSLIYLNDNQELTVRSADQLSSLLHRTLPLSNASEHYEIIPCQDKFLLVTPTHIYARQLYQGLYFLDSIVSSINDENCHVLIELTVGDAQLLLQLLATLDLTLLNHIADFHHLLKKTCDERVSSSVWNLIQIPHDCLNAIKICFDILRLHKQQNQNTLSSLPGIVVVGLLLDYLTRYYHHKKSSSSSSSSSSSTSTNTDEHIGSTMETSSTAPVPPTSCFNTGGKTTRERLMFSEATRYRTFTLWPHAAFRWLSPENMAKAGFYYSPLKDNDDRALCFACTVTLVCWEPSDSPWTEHGRHSPNCPFIKGDFTENVPLRTTCSIQPGKKIFSHQPQQKWSIKSNELLLNERILLFLNSDWLIRSADVTNVIQIRTIVSWKNLIEQLTNETTREDDQFSQTNNQSICIEHFDRSTSKRYFNCKLTPLAISMCSVATSTEQENYLVFCCVRVSESNKCLLIISRTSSQHETSLPQPISTTAVISADPIQSIDQEMQQIEPIVTDQPQSNSKYDYLIEFSNFKQAPQQAFLYQLGKTKTILLINTGEHVHSYLMKYDPNSITVKILSYQCVYRSSTKDIQIDSISPIVFDDDDVFNTDEPSMLSDDEDGGGGDEEKLLELDDDEDSERDANHPDRKRESFANRAEKRKCYLIGLKSGHLILYDVYRAETTDDDQEEHICGYVADVELTGQVDKCVHVRGTETMYAWTSANDVKKLNIRDLFSSYFIHSPSAEANMMTTTTGSMNPSQSKSSLPDANANAYSMATLRSLLSFTSFDLSPATYFFAQVNSSYWIDTLDTTKTNVHRHTWRLQQPQVNQQQQQQQQQPSYQASIPSLHIFDLQTATPCLLHTVEFRYTLNRQHLYKKNVSITLYRCSAEQNDVDQKIEFNQLKSTSNFSPDDILAGPYSLTDYLESPAHDQGLIQLCSYDLLTYKSKRFRLVLESSCSPAAQTPQQGLFPIEIISITLRSAKYQSRLLRLYDRSTIDSLATTILTAANEKTILLSLNLLISILYTTNDASKLNQMKCLLLNERFLQRTFIDASRTVVNRTATFILMVIKHDHDMETFVEKFLNLFQMNDQYLLGFKSSSAMKWLFIILGQWAKLYPNKIGSKLLQWLLQLTDVIQKTDTVQRQLLRNKFGYYADPFDAHLFDVDLTTMIECSLRQRPSNTSSSTSSNPANLPQSIRPPGMTDNGYDPRLYSRYGTTGVPIIPSDPASMYSPANIQYALSKLLPNSLSSSNVYLQPIPGLFEVTALNYTMHSSSDGTHLERVDMNHLLTLRSYETACAPPPPNVTLGASPHHLYHPGTSSAIPPPPLPPAISNFTSSNTFPFSFATPNINTYYDALYMLPSTAHPAATSSNKADDTAPTLIASFPMSVNNSNSASAADSSASASLIAPPWLPHPASKFKDKQGSQKEKLKLIAKKNKAAAAQSSMLKKNSALFNDLIHSSKSLSTTNLSSNQSVPPLSSNSSTANKARADDDNAEQQTATSIATIDDILTQVSNSLLHGQSLPLYQFIIDRLSGGGRSYFVLDFGQQVTLTDILIPSCNELASLSLDFWSHDEHIDCQRLFSSTHIATQPFFLHDLQPAIVARYIRITLIGQANISISSIRLPVGYFFGRPFVSNEAHDHDTASNNDATLEKYRVKLQSIEGIYETLISNYALCRQKLFNLLSLTKNIEKSYIEKIYRECLQLQIQINQASRQINQCRELLKLETFHIHPNEPTSDYLKLLTDLLTSELTSVSGMIQRTHAPDRSSQSSFITLEQALQLFDTFAIRHAQIIDMPKRLLQLCSYRPWWPSFVKECFLRYFLSSTSILTSDQQQSLFINLADLCEQTLLTIHLPNESTISYNRLLAMEYLSNTYELLLSTKNGAQSIEWLLLFLHRLAEKNLFPYSYEQINKKNNFSQLINKHWQFLHTTSIVQIPRFSNSMNNYRRKMRKETILKKSSKSSSSSVSTQTSIASIIIAPNHSVDCFISRSLVLQVAQRLIQILIDHQHLSSELFILICKSLSDMGRACKPLILLTEYISQEDLSRLISSSEQVWMKHALNYLLIDFIDNEIWLPNEINDDDDDIDIDEDKDGNEDEWVRKRHFPAMKKSKKKLNAQQILVHLQNNSADPDLLCSTTDDLLIYLTQSSMQQQHHQQQLLQPPSALAIHVNPSCYDVIPFSVDNRLDGNIQFIFDLFTINESFKTQNLLNKNLFLLNNQSMDYDLTINSNASKEHEQRKFFTGSTTHVLNGIFQTMLLQHIADQPYISYETLNHIEHLLSSYLVISLTNYAKNIHCRPMANVAPTETLTTNNSPPISVHLKPLFFMAVDTLDKLLRFLLRSPLVTLRLWHHVFSLLYYTSTNAVLAIHMKESWFRGDIDESLFAQIWLKFIHTSHDMIDESTLDVVINYFERLFMSDDGYIYMMSTKASKRMAPSDENDPSLETPTFSTSKLNRPYLNTFLSLMNRLVSDGLQGPLNCHLRFLSYLFDLNYLDATPAIRLRLCRNIVDFVWSFCYSHSTLSFTLTDIHPLICFLNVDRTHHRSTTTITATTTTSTTSSMMGPTSVHKWPSTNTTNKLSIQNNQIGSPSTSDATITASKPAPIRRQSHMRDACVRQMILLITKLMESTNAPVAHQHKRFKCEQDEREISEVDDDDGSGGGVSSDTEEELESIYIEKLLAILSSCHSALDSSASVPLNSSTKFLAASISSSNQHPSFVHTTIRLNVDDLLSVGDSIYYCLSAFITRPAYLVPIICRYLRSKPLLSSPLLLFIIYSLHKQINFAEGFNQYKLLDLLVTNLLAYSSYLSSSTSVSALQRIYDQRQSSNTSMDIGSINLASQCQITCSNATAQSPEILIQSTHNLHATLPTSSRRLRSPPWSYTFPPNERRCTLTLLFPHAIILKSIQLVPFTQLSVNHYPMIDHLSTSLSQSPASITCEVSSDGFYFVPCAYLLNTQGQSVINLSITKQIDIVRQLRIHMHKPMDHETIGLQQILIYGYYSYDQQSLIEQNCQPYQTLVSTVYGKQFIMNKVAHPTIVTPLNADETKLMYSSIKSSTNNANTIDNSHQVSLILADQYRSFNHYLQLIHFCLKHQIEINDTLLDKCLFLLEKQSLLKNELLVNEIFIAMGNSCSATQFQSLIRSLIKYDHTKILSELHFDQTKLGYLLTYLTENTEDPITDDSMKQTIIHILWKIEEQDRTIDEHLFASLMKKYVWLLPSIAHHRPLLVIHYLDEISSLNDYFARLKSCAISVQFLDRLLTSERFLRAIEQLDQQIDRISTSMVIDATFIHLALDYFISISKYSNVQSWFAQTELASSIWKKLLDLFVRTNAFPLNYSPSVLLTQLITLLRNLSIQCPTNQPNMTAISSYLAQLTEKRFEQNRPLTGYLQYILSEVVLKQEYIQCLINTRDYPINQQPNAREHGALQRNSAYQRLIPDCPISMNMGQLIEKLFGFNYLQANIWTAANYMKNKSYLIKASSEPAHGHPRKKPSRSEYFSSRANFLSKLAAKSISSLPTLSKHTKTAPKSTSMDSATARKLVSSSAVEIVHFTLHIHGEKRQCILPKTVLLSDLLLSFDCRSLNVYEVDVMELSFDNHILLNESQEKDLITNKSLVANRDYPTLLDTFVQADGLKILAQHFARNYPSIQSYDECVSSASTTNNVFDRINFFDFSSLVSTSRSSTNNINNMSMPYYVFITFSIFLRLPNYARAMLKERSLACNIIRLMLGQKESIFNDQNDQFQQNQDNFDMRQLSKLPFETLAVLLKHSSDELLDEILHSSILLLLLSCLSSITRHPHRKQKDSSTNQHLSGQATAPASTTLISSLPPAPPSSAHNESMLDDNDDDYYEDDIEQIESATIQQLNTINNSNNTTGANPSNSNFWAKGTGFGTGSTHSQWKPDEILQIQKLHEEHVVYLFDIFYSIFSNKLSEDILNEHLVEIIDTSCLIPVLESYLRNDSILDLSKQGDIHWHCLRLVYCLLDNKKLKNLIYQTSNIGSLIANLLQCVQSYTSMIQIDEDEQLNLLAFELKKVHDKIKEEEQLDKEMSMNDPSAKINYQPSITLENFYCKTMKALQFSTFPITIENESGDKVLFNKSMKYHYEDIVRDALNTTSVPRIKRLAQEQITISTSLPLSFSSTIFARWDENRMDVMRVLITGPDGTPYSNGCFLFDVYFPNEYPTSPPSIHLETTGNHTVRFNPNLYNDGKVCLSILNTWHGRPEEKWNSTSTFLQVLVSIQSLIFVPEPYFNEPGYERTRGTATGTAQSLEHDANIRQATVRWAMLEQLRNPPACFTDVIQRHFFLKRHEILQQCDAWIRELQETSLTEKRVSASISQHVAALVRHTNDLKKEFARLSPPTDLDIPADLTTLLLDTSPNNDSSTDQVASSVSPTATPSVLIQPIPAKKKSVEQSIDPSVGDEHSIQIKLVHNLQYQSASAAGQVESPITLIDAETQQSSNSSVDAYEQQQTQSSSTDTSNYDVTITHSNSLLSDWTTTDTPTLPLADDGLIYDDLLDDDEDDMDDDLDVDDMLEYDGDIPEGYPDDFY